MPKIEQYQSRVQTPGPVDIPRANADTMGAALGRGQEKLGEAVSSVANVWARAVEQDEVSEINKNMAVAKADFAMDLQDRVKKGEINKDPDTGEYTFTDDFKSNMQKRMDDIGKNINTRRGQMQFEQDSASTMANFTVDAYKAQSQLIGIKARKDYEVSFNARSSQLINNPSAYEQVLSDNVNDINSRVETGQIDATTAETLISAGNKKLAESYIKGWAKLDTKKAKELLDSGAVDNAVDGDQKYELYARVKAEERAVRMEENLLKQQEKEAKLEADMSFMDDVYTRIKTGKAGGIKREILDSDLDWNKKKQMMDIIEHEATKKIKTNKDVFISLFTRINADETDPKKIRNDEDLLVYAQNGLIDMKDLQTLRKEVRGYNTQAGSNEQQLKSSFFREVQNRLVKKDAFGNADPQGQQAYINAVAQFQEAYQSAREKGKSPAELLVPTSPDYMGKIVDPYVKSPQQRMKDQINTLRPAPAPLPAGTPPPVKRNPNESAADYLKRIGK